MAGVGVIRVPPARSLSGVGSAADRRISAMRAGGARIGSVVELRCVWLLVALGGVAGKV